LSDYLGFTIHGKAKFVETRLPTASEVDARIKDLFVDSSTGVHYICIDDTTNAQQWQGTDNTVVPLSIASPAHPNLVAFYTMDNISGSTLIDESPNNEDSTITGALTVTGHIGNALEFNGAPDHVTTPIIHSGTVVSISLWFNPSDILSRRFIFADFSTSGLLEEARVALAISSVTGKYEIVVGDGTLSFQDTSSFNHSLVNGTYSHIVYIVDGSNVLIYEDSILKHTIPIGFTVGSTPAGDTWVLGRAGALGALELLGEIDQCRRFDKVLNQAEINTLFNSGVGA
jgi:hypothetical protein